MEIHYGREFHTWLKNLGTLNDKESRTRLELALALLTSAAPRAEASIDQWKREQERR